MVLATPFVEVMRRPELNIGPCREYQGSCNDGGYGVGRRNGKTVYLHRWAYEQAFGPTELDVLHHCDNPPCSQESHLFAGTEADNMRDCVAKGRQSRGEQRPGAKLTAADVSAIRKHLANGMLQREIAALFGVHPSRISFIATGKNWSHVE